MRSRPRAVGLNVRLRFRGVKCSWDSVLEEGRDDNVSVLSSFVLGV